MTTAPITAFFPTRLIVRLLIMSLVPTSALTADVVTPLWHEGENFTTVSGNPANAIATKPPASGGASTAGSIFAKAGNGIHYTLELPQAIPEAKLVLRYARLHFRETMEPAVLQISLANSGQTTEATIVCGNTYGWGTNHAREWRFVEVDLGKDLEAGAVDLHFSVEEDHGNLNIDGFFLAPSGFAIASEELSRLQRVHLSGSGYVGLDIPGDTVFPGAFDGFAVVGRAFEDKTARLRIAIKDTGGALHPIGEEHAMDLRNSPRSLRIDATSLAEFSDGEYQLQVDVNEGEASLRHPLSIMRDLVARAREYAHGIRATITRFRGASERDSGVQTAEWKLIPDLEHAADYIDNTLLVLEARQRGESTTSERAAALAYFERSKTRTAKDFAADLENIMAQTARSLALAADNRNPYEDRPGDLRRAFYSTATGALEPYRIFLPEDYARLDSIPLILMLHGGGGDENYFPDLDDGAVKRVLEDRPHIMLSPKSTSWYRGPGLSDLKQLVDSTLEAFPRIDSNRIYCTGVSAGGGGTFNMAMAYPDLFRGIACVSSGPRITDEVERLGNLPILLLNGQMDVVIPVEQAREAAAELEKRNHPHRLVVFPNHGHEYRGEEYLELTLDFFEKHL